MGFFYRPAGGGGALSVNPSLGDSDATAGVSFVNETGSTDTITLAFADGLLQGVDPDSGTPASPSYTVPSGVSSKTILVERSSTATTEDNDQEVITYTGNAGTIGTLTYTIADTFATRVRRLATPKFEFNLAASTANSGSASITSLTAVKFDTYASRERPGIIGLGTQYESTSTLKGTITKSDINASTDRSWIYVWVNGASVAGSWLTLGYPSSADTGPGWLGRSGSTWKYTNYPTQALDTSGSKTSGGSSEQLDTSAGDLCVLVTTYDATAATLDYRWKQSSHTGSGHSVITGTSKSAETGTGTYVWYFCGYGSAVAQDVDWLYTAVIDHKLTEAEFDDLYETLE